MEVSRLDIKVPGYTAVRLLGRGGMGVVYEATHDPSGRAVAVKVLDAGALALKSRFAREARTLRQLSHPHVCEALDFGELDSGGLFLVMELLTGEDLGERLEREGALAPEDAVRIAREAAAGLAHAHDAGVVHRDVKPSNLFLVEGQGVKVVDFGLAAITSRESPAARLTRTGDVLGTPAYMAPEQARGDRSEGTAADVYGLGAVLYHALSGQPPYGGDNALAVIVRMLTASPPPVRSVRPEVPPALAALVDDMLAREPASRPRDMRAVIARLEGCLSEVASIGADETVALSAGETLGIEALGLTGLAPSTGLGAEQRLVTVLLASDVTDSHWVREVIARFGGEAMQVGPGEVVGLFGVESAEGDEAERAVQAAREVESMCRVVGVGTGRSVGGSKHISDEALQTAVGASVRGGSGVVVDDETASRVSGRFRLDGYHVVGEREDEARDDLPLLGRDSEMADLRARIEEAVDDEEAAGVLLIGPPGVGKSRLVREVVAGAREAEPELVVLVGCGEPNRRFTSWHAVAGAVRQFAGLTEDAAPELALEQLRVAVGQLEVGELCPVFLAAALGVALPDGLSPVVDNARRDPRVMRDQIVSAVGDWAEALAERAPLMLVLEDVQWADEPSLELVDILFRRVQGAPMFMLVTGRPHALDERPELFDVPQIDRRELKELSKRAARRLVDAALLQQSISLDDELRDELAAHAGGNPFFVREIVRHVAERVREHGAEAFDPAAFALPLTVEAAIQSRLDHLAPPDKDLLKRASVLGERFWREALPGLGCADPANSLARLTRDDLIRRPPRRDLRLSELDEYGYRQRAVRDVAYGMLTDPQKKSLHLSAGNWLKDVRTARPEEIATHFTTGQADELAAALWVRAAELAERDGDIAAAADRWRFACRGVSGPELFRARMRLARASEYLGRYSEEAAVAEELLADASEPKDIAEVLLRQGIAARNLNDQERCKSILSEAVAHAKRSGDAALIVEASAALAVTLALEGGEEAESLVQSVIGLAESDLSLGRALSALALVQMYSKRMPAAIETVEQAVHAAQRAGDLGLHVGLLGDRGYLMQATGRLEEAKESLKEVIESARRIGRLQDEGYALHNLGVVLMHQDELAEALRAEEQGVELATTLGSVHLRGGCQVYRALILCRLGRSTEAVQAALSAIEDTRGTQVSSMAYAVLAEVQRTRGRLAEALTAAEQAMDLRATLGMLDLELELLVSWARILGSAGEGERAEHAWKEGQSVLEARLAEFCESEADRERFSRAFDACVALTSRAGAP